MDFIDLLLKALDIISKLDDSEESKLKLNELFRYLHTIKGSSAALKGIGSKAHEVESIVTSLTSGEKSLNKENLSIINLGKN